MWGWGEVGKPQNILRAICAVIRPDHFKFASYGTVQYLESLDWLGLTTFPDRHCKPGQKPGNKTNLPHITCAWRHRRRNLHGRSGDQCWCLWKLFPRPEGLQIIDPFFDPFPNLFCVLVLSYGSQHSPAAGGVTVRRGQACRKRKEERIKKDREQIWCRRLYLSWISSATSRWVGF